ncbi:bifunctional diacylglycerol diphosphate phosphatase/phosphatidate phosphatase [Chamberlinius hualienensis]
MGYVLSAALKSSRFLVPATRVARFHWRKEAAVAIKIYNQKRFNSGNFGHTQINIGEHIKSSAKMSQPQPITGNQLSQFVIHNDHLVASLDCEQAFNGLTDQEKLYAHYLSLASWHGGLIVLLQTSPEAPVIYVLLRKLYTQNIDELKEIAFQKCEFQDAEFQAVLVYSSAIFANMGNYRGFGDTKFVPNLPKEKFEALLKNSACYKGEPELIEKLWNSCSEAMFLATTKNKQLGFSDKGVTTYFSANCTKEDAEFIKEFMTLNDIGAYNTRLFKTIDEKLGKVYEIRLASAYTNEDEREREGLGMFHFKDSVVHVTRGDHSRLMNLVVENLQQAIKYASNDVEVLMIKEYIKSFTNGSLKSHKNGSRLWIKDKGPVVETYIGFIESYRDPDGQRGEFEGFVAVVNKAMSSKFGKLVADAELFLPLLPWPRAFEKDKFLRPDFTSLDVITFSGSGIPAGINIPNYDDIRQFEGFKNVSLGNVIPASYSQSVLTFLSESDQELLVKHRVASFEIQVGLHELLGHGSGKLFSKNKDGILNVDPETINPETGVKISSFYENGETYDSRFSSLGSTYEECRAESVGIYLSLNSDILKIFGFDGAEAEDVVYVNWLALIWTGLRGLEMYQPDHKVWGQAHSQARFVILRVLLEAGEGLVSLTERVGTDGNPDLLLTLDRTKIATVGKLAIGNFLRKLQVYKSTADVDNATKLFAKYSRVESVGDGDIPFEEYRNIVVARRQPRKMFVQVNTKSEDGTVKLINYPATHEGVISSWVERFSDATIDSSLVELAEKDRQYFDV